MRPMGLLGLLGQLDLLAILIVLMRGALLIGLMCPMRLM